MGVTLTYHTKPKEIMIHSDYTSDLVEKIKKIFGKSIGESDFDKLESLYIATGDQIYKEFYEAVLKHQEIFLNESY